MSIGNLRELAKEKRKNMPLANKVIWNAHKKEKRFGEKTRMLRYSVLRRRVIVDFYNPFSGLVILIDPEVGLVDVVRALGFDPLVLTSDEIMTDDHTAFDLINAHLWGFFKNVNRWTGT